MNTSGFRERLVLTNVRGVQKKGLSAYFREDGEVPHAEIFGHPAMALHERRHTNPIE
jgi:hypothetical protein